MAIRFAIKITQVHTIPVKGSEMNMKFDGTLYKSRATEWHIRVSPDGVKEDGPEEIFRVWLPNGEKDNSKRWVFYNPKIAIMIRSRLDKTAKYFVPMTMFYSLKDALRIMYGRLAGKELYSKEDGVLYLNQSKVAENSIKLSIFSDSFIFKPALIEVSEEETKRGINIISTRSSDIAPLEMDVNEVKTIYEIIDRLDVNTYTLILAMAEQLGEMDLKLDKIMDVQSKILKLIEKNTVTNMAEQFNVEWE